MSIAQQEVFFPESLLSLHAISTSKARVCSGKHLPPTGGRYHASRRDQFDSRLCRLPLTPSKPPESACDHFKKAPVWYRILRPLTAVSDHVPWSVLINTTYLSPPLASWQLLQLAILPPLLQIQLPKRNTSVRVSWYLYSDLFIPAQVRITAWTLEEQPPHWSTCGEHPWHLCKDLLISSRRDLDTNAQSAHSQMRRTRGEHARQLDTNILNSSR